MADEADKANETADFFLATALRNYKQSPIIATETGYCLHCGEDLAAGKRWCNAEHRDLWQDTYR